MMRPVSKLGSLAFLFGGFVMSCPAHAGPGKATFELLGIPPEGNKSTPNAVSADGSVVVGVTNPGGPNTAFRWTATDGMAALPLLPGFTGAVALGISANGQTVVGFVSRDSSQGTYEQQACQWIDGIPSGLGWLGTAGLVYSEAWDISDNGMVIVGQSSTTGCLNAKQSVRTLDGLTWTALGTLSSPCETNTAHGVSGDGAVIVGVSGNQAFRWTGATQMVSLGFLSGATFPASAAYDISADGNVIVGSARNSEGTDVAARWTSATGWEQLGPAPDGLIAQIAWGVSANGSVIVGEGTDFVSLTNIAFIWDETNGVRNLQQVLVDEFGVDLQGVTLTAAMDVSQDGTTIVGHGYNPSLTEAWIATLPCNFFTNVAGSCEEVDTDDDGLLDDWEINGIPYTDASGVAQRYILDFDFDGTNDADPNHKDLFIEVDAMVGLPPSIDAFITVSNAFAVVPNALLGNPDGQPGVRLHIDSDELNIPVGLWTIDDIDGDGDPDWPTEFDALKLSAASGTTLSGYFGTANERTGPDAAVIREAKRQAYRYCIYGHSLNGTSLSGISERPGNDFAVTLGNWGTPGGGTADQQAGTFMHELGHSLGLKHGGGDHDAYKPNYYSVMNYTWQTPTPWMAPGSWPLSPGRLGYSTFNLLPLAENDLFECQGVGVPSGAFSNIVVPHGTTNNGTSVVATSFMCCPIDWNRDGNIDCFPDEVSVDLNYLDLGDAPSPGGTLNGFADWPVLQYNFRESASFVDGVHVPEDGVQEIELTFEMQMAMEKVLPPFCVGDFGLDRLVNGLDLAQLLGQWSGASFYSPCPPHKPQDLNGDCKVNGLDLALLLGAWGPCS